MKIYVEKDRLHITLKCILNKTTKVPACVCAKSLQSCRDLSDPMDCSPPGSSVHDSPGKSTAVGCHSLLQRIFLTQGSNTRLLHCWQILYHWATWKAHSFPRAALINDKWNCIYLKGTLWWFDMCICCEMITTIKLINPAITSHNYLFFFFWWEWLRSALLTNFRCCIQY